MIRKFAFYSLWTFVILAFASQAHAHNEEDLNYSAHSAKVVAAEAAACGDQLSTYLHPDYLNLVKTNQWLAANAEALTRERLIDLGYLKVSDETVYRMNDKNLPLLDQVLPFRKLILPHIKSGLYEPERPVSLDEHRGILIFLPGIGALTSHAGRILDITSTFHGHRSRNRGGGDKTQDPFEALADASGKFRLASYAFDLTMNGMGAEMPFVFASEPGTIEVLRHVRIILGILNPKLKDVFMAGRSQGGLAAIAYAGKYKDIRGVVAVNPSSPSPTIIAASLRVHDNGGKVFEFRPQLHHRAWGAYQFFTAHFQALSRRTQVPIRLYISDKDESYSDAKTPRRAYLNQMDSFVSQSPTTRSIAHFDYSHDLWVRRENPFYEEVATDMGKFFAQVLRSGN